MLGAQRQWGVCLSHTHTLFLGLLCVNMIIQPLAVTSSDLVITLRSYSITGQVARRIRLCMPPSFDVTLDKQKQNIANNFIEKMDPAQSDRTDVGSQSTDDHVTSYTETIGIVKGVAPTPNLSLVAGTDPYPPGEVTKALTRSYLIDDLEMDTTAVRGDVLDTYEFPQELWTVFNLDKVSYYYLFRAKVKITIRVNCTKFDYGSILISTLPYYKAGQTSNFREANLFALAQNNPRMMSIQQGATLEFEIPWVNPRAYMELSSANPEIGTMFISVLHPLSSASADPPSSVHFLIYAQFVDPELAGYAPDIGPGPVLSTRMKKKRPSPNVKTQSDKKGTVFKEAKAKSESGVIDGVAEGVDTVAAVIGTLGKTLETGLSIAESVGSLMVGLGLNKPSSVEAVKPTAVNPNADLSYCSGLDYGTKMSLRPDYQIATQKGIICAEDPRPHLIDMLRRPSLIACGSFKNTTAPGASITSWTCDPQYMVKLLTTADGTSYQPTFLAWFTSFFSRWRGGLKYMVRFTCSSFMSSRVRLVHLLKPFLTEPLASISGDVVSQVVDINGDRVVTFTVPYISADYYQPTHKLTGTVVNSIGYVDMYLETPIVSPDTSSDPLIFFDIWVGAADDFRVGGVMSPTFGTDTAIIVSDPSVPLDALRPVRSYEDVYVKHREPHETEEERPGADEVLFPENKKLSFKKKKGKDKANAKTQCDPVEEFKKPFPGLIPNAKYVVEHGFVNGEEVGPVTNILHRFVGLQGVENTIYNVAPGGVDDLGIDSFGYRFGLDTHTLWMLAWRFWRGSTRYYMMDVATNYWHLVYRVPYQAMALPWVGASVDWDEYANSYVTANPSQTGWVNRGEIPWHMNTAFIELFGTVAANLPTHIIKFVGNGPSPSTGQIQVLYSMGDDISLGCVGALPALVNPLEVSPPARDSPIKTK